MTKRVFKKIGILLIVALMGTTAAFAADTAVSTAAVPSDVAGTDLEATVKALIEKEIITGDTDGLFHPDSYLTRAQACIIVVKAMNPPAAEITGTATQPAAASGFSDMAGYDWAEGYIAYAVKHGVTKGYSDGTFRPGNNVTGNELATMVLRAAGYTDESLGGTWPENYVDKGIELKLYENIPAMHADATKRMAAEFTYNALSMIEAANPPAETPGQGTDQDKPAAIPDASDMTYATGAFNSSITTYNGKSISDDVIVYTYGEKKSYSSVMKFSAKTSDYRENTIYKYKNVTTPAFYKLENGEITEMILPMDVGFSGRAYSVINGTVNTKNAKGDTVTGLKTLTAGHEITWIGKKGLTGIPENTQYMNGEFYEINLSNGEIQSIFRASDGGKKSDFFEEITGSAFMEVESFKDGVVKFSSGGELFEVKDNASVYILESDEYTAGKLSAVKKGVEIRAYDMSDDDEYSVDIVIVQK
jgi:hypothetical protein